MTENIIHDILKNKTLMAVIGIISTLMVGNAAYTTMNNGEITYQDPNNVLNYMTLDTSKQTFVIHQDNTDEPILTGTYTESFDSITGGQYYNLKYTQGFGQVAEIVEGGVKSPAGNVWYQV
jgi:hypothetical protein